MKNRAILITILLQIVCLTKAQYNEPSDWLSGTKMVESVANMLELKSNLYGYSLRTDYTSMFTAFLSKGNAITFTTYLNSGNNYAFAASGDDNANDVDIYVTNKSGVEVAKDESTSRNPCVYFTPKYSGNYTVKLKLYNAETSGCFCNLLTLIEGGENIGVENITTAMYNTILACAYMYSINNDIKFLNNYNQWCMYGSVLNNGSSNAIENLKIGTEDIILLAWGDDNTSDVDVKLFDKYQNVVCEDTENRALAVCSCSTSSYNSYKLQYKNYRSSGPAVIIAVIMTK